jgi:hypothetical protein
MVTVAPRAELSPTHTYLATVDVWQLRQLRWPIMRAFVPRFVELAELRAYLRELLSTGQWSDVIAMPTPDPAYPREQHLFDIYAIPRS